MDDAIQSNHDWDYYVDDPSEQSPFPQAPGLSIACRDPTLLPRVGDEYQVEIPSFVPRDIYLKLTELPTNARILPGTLQSFLVGLPLSIMWISEDHEHKPVDSNYSNGTSNGNASSMSIQENKEKMQEQCGRKGKPVPGAMSQRWTEAEEAGFLLGLYIFGKNLVQVNKLLDGKGMEEIQSFYYGKFYRSSRYRRWSDGCRVKSRRCVFGPKIFTGWRQQELLSRLLPHLAVESKTAVLEVVKTFGEGRLTLEDYIIALKDLVGLNALVEAVGIGKGKQDLTGLTMDTPKSNQAGIIRPEIPTGKACNSLTPQEIINFLTGGYRLSKARSHDLFWEAVWPRLLARGWHSEQPQDYFSVANSQSLVFMTPGIKKFSRRKLVKGDHYFDCVTDVLNKVASDPALLELDASMNTEAGMKTEDFSDQQRHCYLKPRNTVQNADTMRFTVVDTSLGGGGTKKVRELRSLPIETNGISASYSDSEESDSNSSKDAMEVSHDMNGPGASKSGKSHVSKGISFHKQNVQTAFGQSGLTKCPGLNGVRGRAPHKQKVAKFGDLQPRKATKDDTIQRIKPGSRKFVAPIEQGTQLRLASGQTCSSHAINDPLLGPNIDQEGGGNPGKPVVVNNSVFVTDYTLEEMPTSTHRLFMGSSDVRNDQRLSHNPCNAEGPGETPHIRTLFDLNALPTFEDADIGASMAETTRRFNETSRQPEIGRNSAALTVRNTASDQPAAMSSRRQGTRNRPPTAKALEAVAAGYLSAANKRKSKDDYLENSTGKPARRPRSGLRISESLNAATTNYKEIERDDMGPQSDSDMLG